MLDVVAGVGPAFCWVPPHVGSAGGEAADLAASVGLVPDAAQRVALDAILAERADGSWAAFEAALIAPRQNLKSATFEMVVVADLWLFGTDLVTWTAHEFSTTQEAFRNVVARAENYDHLRRRVKRVSHASGREGIELVNGSRLKFKARTKTGGRGLTASRVILDEAFALDASVMGALMPTMSAVKNPQVLYGSSAGLEESAVLRTVRDRGRAGGDASLVYLEWCSLVECSPRCDHRVGSAGCVLDDEGEWGQANPALGDRISVEHLRRERLAMPSSEFGRERLGRWDDPGGALEGLPALLWAACADKRKVRDVFVSQIVGVPVFAAVVAHDLSWSAIATAGMRVDGLPHVEVVDYKPGTGWVAGRCAGLLAKHGGSLIVESAGPRSSVPDDLDDLNVSRQEVSAVELVAACGVIEDSVRRGALRHLGQPELDVAVAVGRRRTVGDAWTWARRASEVEISPLVAVSLALWGLRNTNAPATGAGFVSMSDLLGGDTDD